jgi:hypothetical protein
VDAGFSYSITFVLFCLEENQVERIHGRVAPEGRLWKTRCKQSHPSITEKHQVVSIDSGYNIRRHTLTFFQQSMAKRGMEFAQSMNTHPLCPTTV